jgi:hypothetical protein
MPEGLYGHKCHLCAHLDGPTHHVERHWPVADDECPDCSFCQEAAFVGAFIRAHGGDELFDPETRAAVKALMAGKPHPVIDKSRAEIAHNDGSACGSDRT